MTERLSVLCLHFIWRYIVGIRWNSPSCSFSGPPRVSWRDRVIQFTQCNLGIAESPSSGTCLENLQRATPKRHPDQILKPLHPTPFTVKYYWPFQSSPRMMELLALFQSCLISLFMSHDYRVKLKLRKTGKLRGALRWVTEAPEGLLHMASYVERKGSRCWFQTPEFGLYQVTLQHIFASMVLFTV